MYKKASGSPIHPDEAVNFIKLKRTAERRRAIPTQGG
jgi:hypothetical protein